MTATPPDTTPARAQIRLRDLPLATITERWPMTLTVFHAHGMDACCGGQLPLGNAAKIHGLDIDLLEDELAQADPAALDPAAGGA